VETRGRVALWLQQMEVSGQLHASAGWAPDPVWTLWEKEQARSRVGYGTPSLCRLSCREVSEYAGVTFWLTRLNRNDSSGHVLRAEIQRKVVALRRPVTSVRACGCSVEGRRDFGCSQRRLRTVRLSSWIQCRLVAQRTTDPFSRQRGRIDSKTT
jgi:hypothetical protein